MIGVSGCFECVYFSLACMGAQRSFNLSSFKEVWCRELWSLLVLSSVHTCFTDCPSLHLLSLFLSLSLWMFSSHFRECALLSEPRAFLSLFFIHHWSQHPMNTILKGTTAIVTGEYDFELFFCSVVLILPRSEIPFCRWWLWYRSSDLSEARWSWIESVRSR